jgi:hypothetical protein
MPTLPTPCSRPSILSTPCMNLQPVPVHWKQRALVVCSLHATSWTYNRVHFSAEKRPRSQISILRHSACHSLYIYGTCLPHRKPLPTAKRIANTSSRNSYFLKPPPWASILHQTNRSTFSRQCSCSFTPTAARKRLKKPRSILSTQHQHQHQHQHHPSAPPQTPSTST